MFPFNQGGDLSFQAAANPPEEEQSYHQDLILDDELLAAVNLYNPSTSTTVTFSHSPVPTHLTPQQGTGRSEAAVANNEVGFEENDRKMLHRAIERQRRQEMSTLLTDLRSLLPLHYLKGKRSTSDHIAESVNYIKELEEIIKELGETRDQLRRVVATRDESGSSSSTIISIPYNVDVFNMGGGGGLWVQISGGQAGDGSSGLSRAHKVLLEAGLDVVSCISNHVNGTLLHNIHCLMHGTEMTWDDIEVQQLRERLYQVVCSN